MTALLARLLAAPRWLTLAAGIATALATHAVAWRAGAAHEFRAGFVEGAATATARHGEAAAARTTRQLQDRLDAETRPRHSPYPDAPDGLRCGPSTRDCARHP